MARILLRRTLKTNCASATAVIPSAAPIRTRRLRPLPNYVTARFGAERSKLTDKDVAELRRQAAD
jgi:hypothetical protein